MSLVMWMIVARVYQSASACAGVASCYYTLMSNSTTIPVRAAACELELVRDNDGREWFIPHQLKHSDIGAMRMLAEEFDLWVDCCIVHV